MTRHLVFVLLVLWQVACAAFYPPGSPPFTPEAPAPTTERLAALLDAPVPSHGHGVMPVFALTVYPLVPRLGGAVRLTCWVPRDHAARWIRYGLEFHQSRGWMRLEHIEHRFLVERVSCGSWTAFCELSTGELRTHVVTVPC